MRVRSEGLGALVCLLLVVAATARADEVTVPVDLQVQLLGRVARYERGFASRAGSPVKIMVVARRGHAESLRVAAQLTAALGRAGSLGDRSIVVTRHEYRSEAALRGELAQAPPDVLYLAAGMADSVPAVARAVGTRNVITVSAVGRDVDRGVVLGFELVSSRPQIAVNLPRARSQQLDFSARLLRLARVIR